MGGRGGAGILSSMSRPQAGTGAHEHDIRGSRLRLAFLLTVVVMAVEVAAGLAAHSLALLSDAGHVLTDTIALGFAWFAVGQAWRPADSRRTFGYHRVGILTALGNGATLIVVVTAIAVEAVRRLRHPEPVQGGLVVAAALVALAVNALIGLSLRHAAHDLNIRAALVHVVGDMAVSGGVVLSGAVILTTGWLPADPVLSLAIAGVIAYSAVGVVRTTVHILLEGTPADLDLCTSGRCRPSQPCSAATWSSMTSAWPTPSSASAAWRPGSAGDSTSGTRPSNWSRGSPAPESAPTVLVTTTIPTSARRRRPGAWGWNGNEQRLGWPEDSSNGPGDPGLRAASGFLPLHPFVMPAGMDG